MIELTKTNIELSKNLCIFISRTLKDNYLTKLKEVAEILNVTVYDESNMEDLYKKWSLELHKYGYLPWYVHSAIIRKKGKVISGDLVI